MEVQRCILPAGGATLRMPERAGVGNAMLHLLTADEFDASEAYRCNFVQKVVPAAELLDTALGLARRIAAQAPAAVVATRLNVLKAIELGQAAAVADFIPVQQRLASSEDAAEGVRSFIEKRPARFTGR
jgi:enoyl-CoA hydratase/carnithine racemase